MPNSASANAPRVLSIAGSAVLAVAATALLAIGGLALWGNTQKDDQGYLSTGDGHVATASYALASDRLDIDSGAPHWLVDHSDYGKVRLDAQSRDGKPVFVGIAHTSDVNRYLAGAAHATVTDFHTGPFHIDADEHTGDRAPLPPAESSIWTASAHGTGTQRLDWDVTQGSWSIVVMNANGSRGVDATVSAGAKLPFLTPVAWSAIGGGIALLLAAGGLLYLGVRPSRVPPAPTATPVAV
jgi:hypothetical protein